METLAFLAKKILSRVFFPVELVLLAGLGGWLLWRRRGRSRLGPGMVLGALVLLLLLSLPPVSWLLLRPLELSAGDYADPARMAVLGVRDIVVLGGGVNQGRRVGGDTLNETSLKRLLEGIRLYRALPGSRLVLSGGGFLAGRTSGRAMARLARQLGVPQRNLVVEDRSWDTEDQARVLAGLLGKRPFALVTSATHLGRALAYFRAEGLAPLPAPTDFKTRGFRLTYQSFIPQAGALYGCEEACYEYLGRLWMWLKGTASRPPRAGHRALPANPARDIP